MRKKMIGRLALGLIVSASAAQACDFKPKTELEEVYCKVRDRKAGQGLPNIFEFRKNPPQIQALLLKKDAQRLGIDIPQPKEEANSAREEKIDAPTSRPENRESPAPVETNNPEPQTGNGLSDCSLNRQRITCGEKTYVLQANLQNRQLESGALSDENRLLLPSRNAPQYRDKSVRYYLSSIYPQYLEKMLSIGLADATMSFTKFAATYEDITRQGSDFSERFTKMYELLKEERRSNAVRARYNNNFPTTIGQCMAVSSEVLVCDDIRQNWVYKQTH